MKVKIAKWGAVILGGNFMLMSLMAVICGIIMGWRTTVPYWFEVYSEISMISVVAYGLFLFIANIKTIFKRIDEL